MTTQNKQNLLQVISQLWKFGLVGFLNTGVDFLITNLLFWFFKPKNMFGLMLISVFAILAAAVNSYFLNKFWTFNKKTSMKAAEIYRFSIVTFLGMLVNTSIFLFASKYLAELFSIQGFININAARLTGVAVAMGVTFLGYRFGVFDTESVNDFRKQFTFNHHNQTINWKLLLCLGVIALFLRILFVWIAPVAYGDAVNYSWNAYFLTHGAIDSVDWFWHSLFTYWEAFIFLFGLSRYYTLVLSSLLPGLLLLIPLYLVANNLFGNKVAFFATLATVFHPRMIEYSVNGYSESFVIFFILWAVWGMERIITRQKKYLIAAFITGIASACYFIVRNETIFIIVIFLVILIVDAVKTKKIAPCTIFLGTFILTSSLYIYANLELSNTVGIFQKTSNFTKRYSEQLDMTQSAKEVYGKQQTNKSTPPPLSEIASTLIKRYPRNILYTGERLPGIFFSPLILFIPFLWLMTKQNKKRFASVLPIWIVTLFPFVFYPVFQVEPRYFFFALPSLQIFGVAGFLAFVTFVTKNSKLQYLINIFLFIITALAFIPFIVLVAWNSEFKRGYHREVGIWIKNNMPADIGIAGDGYGYTNTFWAEIPKKHSRIWTNDPAELTSDTIEHKCSLLIINEKFLKQANKKLLNTINDGIPKMKKIKEFTFPYTGKIQLYIPEKMTIKHIPNKKRQ